MAETITAKKSKNNKSMKKSNKKINIAVTLSLVLCGLLVVFPIFWMIRTSLMSNLEINQYPPSLFPKKWLFSNYSDALTTFTFGRYLANTLTIVLSSVVGVIITASIAAYAFARIDFRLKNLWFTLVIGSMLMPPAVTLIPIFIAWSKFGFYNSYVPLIVPAYLGGGAFNIFLIRQFMMTIPKDIDEAAIIDGASHMHILFKIIMPMIKPVLISVGLFTFINLWNDLLGPVIYISDQAKNTIAQGLATFKGGFGTNWRVLMAASCMSTLPAVVLYVIGQKYFIEGIVLTGLKS